MQWRKALHLGGRQGVAVSDKHQGDTTSRRKTGGGCEVSHHKIGPDAREMTVPFAQKSAQPLSVGKPCGSQNVAHRARRAFRDLSVRHRRARPKRCWINSAAKLGSATRAA